MRTYIWLAILGLLVMEALLLPRTVTDFRIMRKVRAENMPEEGLPAILGPFAGFDAGGRPLTLTTEEARWIVPVVIRSTTTAYDLEYLSRLRQALSSREIVVVGVCEMRDCVSGVTKGKVLADFAIVAYGSYAPLSDIARFDDRGQLLLLNQYWAVKRALPRPASPEELATEIHKAIAQ